MKIVNKKRFITFIMTNLTILVLLFNVCLAKTETVTEDYTVAAGDTLWSIACENAETDIREYIYELREINNLNDCMIYPGQTIKIIK
ncbi:MAG: LysM peptidoglycan-binding domain-containing protein [Clostridia bacterium]|nr:LysM peptidoglycan-binding domain-containing protein [Clostridia bacterium]